MEMKKFFILSKKREPFDPLFIDFLENYFFNVKVLISN